VTRVIALALLAGLIAAGCGPPGPKIYDASKTRDCLRGKGVQLGLPPASDFVATTALGGAFEARLSTNNVTIAFGDTLDHADNIDQAYRTFHAHNVGIEDVLRQQGNAVMLWHKHPANADVALVEGCLST
jgi:hypothetical protein